VGGRGFSYFLRAHVLRHFTLSLILMATMSLFCEGFLDSSLEIFKPICCVVATCVLQVLRCWPQRRAWPGLLLYLGVLQDLVLPALLVASHATTMLLAGSAMRHSLRGLALCQQVSFILATKGHDYD